MALGARTPALTGRPLFWRRLFAARGFRAVFGRRVLGGLRLDRDPDRIARVDAADVLALVHDARNLAVAVDDEAVGPFRHLVGRDAQLHFGLAGIDALDRDRQAGRKRVARPVHLHGVRHALPADEHRLDLKGLSLL